MNSKNLIMYGILGVLAITLISIALRKIKEQNNRGGIIAPTQPKLPNIQSDRTNAGPDPFVRANTANPAGPPNRSTYNARQQQESAKKIAKIVIIVIILFNFLPLFFGIIVSLIAFFTTKSDIENSGISPYEPSSVFRTELDDGALETARDLNDQDKLTAEVYVNGEKRDDIASAIDLNLVLGELHNHEVAEPFTFISKGDKYVELTVKSEADNFNATFEFAITDSRVVVIHPEHKSTQVYNGYFASSELENHLREITKE